MAIPMARLDIISSDARNLLLFHHDSTARQPIAAADTDEEPFFYECLDDARGAWIVRSAAKFRYGTHWTSQKKFQYFPSYLALGTRKSRLPCVVTAPAIRIFPLATRLPERLPKMRSIVHERVIPRARIPPIERRLDEWQKLRIRDATAARKEVAQERTPDVRLDEHGWLIERINTNGGRGICADARKLLQFIRISRHASLELADDAFRRAFQKERPPIVSETRPCGEHVAERRPDERPHGRKFFKESWIKFRNPRHLCLLQHDFRHENMVGIPGAPEWQVMPPVCAVVFFYEHLKFSYPDIHAAIFQCS